MLYEKHAKLPNSRYEENTSSEVKAGSRKSISQFTQDEEFVKFLKQVELFTTNEDQT